MTGTMSEKLKPLLTVQDIDLKLESLREQRDVWPAKIREAESRRETLVAQRDELHTHRTALQVERDRLQLEAQEELERILTYERHIREIKNNREYQALIREVGAAKKAKQEAEETAIATMQEIESVEAEIAAFDEQVAAVDAALAEFRGNFHGIAEQIDQETHHLDGQRRDVAGHVDAPLMLRYTTIRKRHNVVVVHAEAGTCTGCHRKLPPQLYNQVLRDAQLIVCPSCQRLLLPPATATAAAPATAASPGG